MPHYNHDSYFYIILSSIVRVQLFFGGLGLYLNDRAQCLTITKS